MKEAALLMAVEGIIRGIEVQDDAIRDLIEAVEKEVYEKSIDRLGVHRDAAVSVVGSLFGQSPLESIQGAAAGQRNPVISRSASLLAGGIGLATAGRQQGISAKMIVIIEVFVAQSQSEDSLTQQILDRMLDPFLDSVIFETLRKAFEDSDSLIDVAQKHGTAIRSYAAPVERGRDFATTWPLKEVALTGTVCFQGRSFISAPKCFFIKHL